MRSKSEIITLPLPITKRFSRILSNNGSLIIYFPISPDRLIRNSLTIGILPKSLLYPSLIFSYIFSNNLTLTISPLTPSSSMHFACFPLALVDMSFASECPRSLYDIVKELTLVFGAIGVCKLTSSIFSAVDKEAVVNGAIFVAFDPFAIF